jgi:hypothetical protein
MTTQKDDFEAVRAVVAALEGFEPGDQERIIRWAREKLGLAVALASSPPPAPAPLPAALSSPPLPSLGTRDLKAFIAEKQPKSDVQFAAAVAYYYRFEAGQAQRKVEVNSEDLQDACRLANRERFKHPGQTLRNAHMLGLLDKGSQSGYFNVNSVGENLVAMTLPGHGGEAPKAVKRRKSLGRKKAARAAKK